MVVTSTLLQRREQTSYRRILPKLTPLPTLTMSTTPAALDHGIPPTPPAHYAVKTSSTPLKVKLVKKPTQGSQRAPIVEIGLGDAWINQKINKKLANKK